MRHKPAKKASPEYQHPEYRVRASDKVAAAGAAAVEETHERVARGKAGPTEASWSHAEWLALADQALADA